MYVDKPEDSYAAKEEYVRPNKSKLPLSQQEMNIDELHKVISQLTDRLSMILTPQDETPAKEPSPETMPVQSVVVHQLESNNAGIRKAIRKLEDLIERIEC